MLSVCCQQVLFSASTAALAFAFDHLLNVTYALVYGIGKPPCRRVLGQEPHTLRRCVLCFPPCCALCFRAASLAAAAMQLQQHLHRFLAAAAPAASANNQFCRILLDSPAIHLSMMQQISVTW